MKELNKTEQKIWEYILVYLEDHDDIAPTNEQIAKHLGLKKYAKQYVYNYVKSIECKKSVVFTTERKMEVINSLEK